MTPESNCTRIDGETFQWAAVDGEGVVFFSCDEAEARAIAAQHGITVVRAEKTREA